MRDCAILTEVVFDYKKGGDQMFIIWGNRSFKKIIGGTGQLYRCGNCNNVNQYPIIKITKWFTLFFIPIFPYSTQYFIMCPICNRGSYVTKKVAMETLEEANRLQWEATQQLNPQNDMGSAV